MIQHEHIVIIPVHGIQTVFFFTSFPYFFVFGFILIRGHVIMYLNIHPRFFLIDIHGIITFIFYKPVTHTTHDISGFFSVFTVDQKIQISHLTVFRSGIESLHDPAFHGKYAYFSLFCEGSENFVSFTSLYRIHHGTGLTGFLPFFHDICIFRLCDLPECIVCHADKIVIFCRQEQLFHRNFFRLWLRFPLFQDRTDQLNEIFGCKNFFLFLLLFLFFCFYV